MLPSYILLQCLQLKLTVEIKYDSLGKSRRVHKSVQSRMDDLRQCIVVLRVLYLKQITLNHHYPGNCTSLSPQSSPTFTEGRTSEVESIFSYCYLVIGVRWCAVICRIIQIPPRYNIKQIHYWYTVLMFFLSVAWHHLEKLYTPIYSGYITEPL